MKALSVLMAFLLALICAGCASDDTGEAEQNLVSSASSFSSVSEMSSDSSQSISPSTSSSETSASVSAEHSSPTNTSSASPSSSKAPVSQAPARPAQSSNNTGTPSTSSQVVGNPAAGRTFAIFVTQVGGTTWQDPPTVEITDPEEQQMILGWIERLLPDTSTQDKNPSMGSASYTVQITQHGETEEYEFSAGTDDVGRHHVRYDGQLYLSTSDSYDYFFRLFGEDERTPSGSGTFEVGESTITISEVGTVEPVEISDPITVASAEHREDILGWIGRLVSTRTSPDAAAVDFLYIYEVTVTDEWGGKTAYQFTNLTDELGRHYVRQGASWYLAASDSFDHIQYFYREG